MMASMELISLTLLGLLPFLLLLMSTSAAAHGSPPTASPSHAHAPPARRHVPSAAPKSSRAATCRDKN
jgi:hypothetical protein